MIQETQRGLILIFTVTILGFTAAVIAAAAAYAYVSVDRATRRHLIYEIQSELVPYYQRNDLTSLLDLSESDYFQILNRSGEVVVTTLNAQGFDVRPNRALLEEAYAGRTGFETATVRGAPFLVAYFPLDEFYAGRAATSLALREQQWETAGWLALFGLPVLAALSFLVSRALVRRAMRPVGELITFHSTFASNVSHELRSPLTALKGNMEVALRREQTPDEYRAVLETGLQEAERLVGTLDNLNLLATTQARGVAPMRGEADLRALMEAIIAGERATLESEGLSLDLAPGGPVPCRCDPSLMRHALRNLLENALRYTPPGGRIAVDVDTLRGEAAVTLANPCEAPRQPPQTLLEPFLRGENRAFRLAHGRGLGLYLARTIVRAHGGELSVALEAGPRFVVRLTLPAGAPPA